MGERRFYATVGVIGVAILSVVVWGSFQVAEPVVGAPCATTNAAAAEAQGLAFNHTMASMRDPVNGILVVAAIGQPYIECAQVFSTFRCEQAGPATVRVRAGPRIGFFEVPEGENAIIQGNGEGEMTCIIPDASTR